MLSEKLLSRLGNYLILTVVILLVGLINSDGSTRGFPFPWIDYSGHILPQYFIPSVIAIAAVVTGGDILAKMYILIKEPRLIVNTREPSDMRSYGDTIEMANPEPEIIITESETSADGIDILPDDDMIEKAERKMLNRIPVKKGESKDTKKDNSFPVVGALVIGSIILSMALSFFGSSWEDDNSLDFFEDDEIVLDADSGYGSIEEAVSYSAEQLFESLQYEDYDYFEDFASYEEAEEILELTDWSDLDYEEISSYISEEDVIALYKYAVIDSYGNSYLLAAYMDIGENIEGYECTMSGVAVISETDLDESRNKVADEKNLTQEEYENYFMNKITNVGNISINEEHILFWDYDGQNLTGLEV